MKNTSPARQGLSPGPAAHDVRFRREEPRVFKKKPMWTRREDEHGWVSYTRGNCRIVVPPSEPGAKPRVKLFAPGVTSEHVGLDAAKRAALLSVSRGW
jgi:hypothetical protein